MWRYLEFRVWRFKAPRVNRVRVLGLATPGINLFGECAYHTPGM